ncbi:GatB/YqeY domain-containing protein [Roseiarcaceae bacterium H3SJ34-1]|uniref:GatB/YqeY domain-containing protein n=1 Tax=Terripilifer ovatus TaxID=3032367 RepID=UPI003AB96A2C|nr:GatB/YqeY domain-containing protein [Roseiarcaceae bacterium H3SJ34-1]
MREQFTTVMKEAMKAGDKGRLAAVRLIMAALKDKDIEARGLGKTVSDEDILGLLQKMVKSRQESAEIYAKAGRPELEAQERQEIAVISEFLPKQMSDDEVKAAIQAAIAETGASSMKDMGKVVGVLRAKYAGQIDFGKASGLVKGMLAG